MENFILILTVISLALWIGLLLFRGQFWKADQRLPEVGEIMPKYPSVSAIVPARDEAEFIGASLRSLLSQDYPGLFQIILVDDHSSDGTAGIAGQTAAALKQGHRLHIIASGPLPAGWTGKLWAMEQGIQYVRDSEVPPDYLLLTDADVEHSRDALKRLVGKAEAGHLQMASLMVMLNCQSFWEKLLIPAFVFFFQKLYPFRRVNDPRDRLAAAAGGCILIRRDALARIGSLRNLKNPLIDDCSLAREAKRPGDPIWLGLTETSRSLRSYPNLSGIWNMVARTAFSQLNYSYTVLGLTLIGMTLTYFMPPIGLAVGIYTGNGLLVISAALTWLLMTIACAPTLKLYRLSPVRGFALPLSGLLYSLMTLDSALKHGRGQGGSWKGRTYPGRS